MDKRTHRTPYRDDALFVGNGTQPEEIHDFLMRRVQSPIEVGTMVVWDFGTHVVDEEQLESQADDLMKDEYIIPYPASGAWAYMASLLPERMREMEILAYSQKKGQYNPYPNYFRHTTQEVNDEIRQRIVETIDRW